MTSGTQLAGKIVFKTNTTIKISGASTGANVATILGRQNIKTVQLDGTCTVSSAMAIPNAKELHVGSSTAGVFNVQAVVTNNGTLKFNSSTAACLLLQNNITQSGTLTISKAMTITMNGDATFDDNTLFTQQNITINGNNKLSTSANAISKDVTLSGSAKLDLTGACTKSTGTFIPFFILALSLLQSLI